MSTNASFSKIREALSEVQHSGQHAVDINALLAFLSSVEDEAPLEAEIRKLNHDSQLAQYKAAHERGLAAYRAAVDTETEMFRSVIETAKTALSTSILVNGGATVALLAFIGNLMGTGNASAPPSALVFSLIAFALGVLAGAVATGSTYCSQFCYHHEYKRSATTFHVITVLLVVSAYIAFAVGVVAAYHGFIR